MARQLPKNVRQIGNVNDTPKIYVEDYVDTFFTQLCDKAGEEPIGAFLIGDFEKTEEEEYIYIYGAIRMQELKCEGTDYVMDEEVWKKAYEDCKQYFEDGEMLGWFVTQAGIAMQPDRNMGKLHKKSFPKKNTVLILKDSIEKDEMYYVHKFNDLLPIGGHYTYYEKNPCMQNYMISTRKKNGAMPTEAVEDRAAKDFRGLVRAREERQQQKRTARAMYSLSACLVLLVLIMGVATMNNLDKMRSVQKKLDNLAGTTSEDGTVLAAGETDSSKDAEDENGDRQPSGDKDDEVVETGGNVTAVTGDNADDGQQEGNAGSAEGDSGESAEGAAGEGSAGEGQGSEQTSAENGSDGVYIVEKGDTLAMISQKIYGDISHVDAICRMNGLEDGNLIFIGQKLLLP